jgi:tripartite-type tricarboxylate transporter receptor subunit TctC
VKSYRMFSFLVATVFAVATGSAKAQQFPNGTVRIINPFAAGGATEVMARAIAQRLSEVWGQPVIVESRPGAGSVLGVDSVVKSPADGHTLLFTDSASFTITPHINSKLPYDPLKDLAPLALCARIAPVLAAANNAPFNSVPEMLAYANANPDALTFASSGVGSYMHIAMEYLKHMTGTKILHVPFRGSNLVVPELLAGRISMYMATLSVFDQYALDGKMKIVAAATEKRLPQRPNLATIGEAVPGYFISSWFGMAAPAGTPSVLLDKIHADIMRVIAEPAFKSVFVDKQFFQVGDLNRADLIKTVHAEHKKWGELISLAGVPQQ